MEKKTIKNFFQIPSLLDVNACAFLW